VNSPVTPWHCDETLAAEITSVLDLAQVSITVALLTLNTNIGDTYDSTVAVTAEDNDTGCRLLSTKASPRMRKQVSRMLLQSN